MGFKLLTETCVLSCPIRLAAVRGCDWAGPPAVPRCG